MNCEQSTTGREILHTSTHDRYSLLASVAAGVSVGVVDTDLESWTDGHTIHVRPGEGTRLQVLLQAALIGAGSLAPTILRQLHGHPALTRRYLLIEGHRALDLLGSTFMPDLGRNVGPSPIEQHLDSSLAALDLARTKVQLPEPPAWFGAIRPKRVLATEATDHQPALSASDLACIAELLEEADNTGVDEPSGEIDDQGDCGSNPRTSTSPPGDTALARAVRRLVGKGKGHGGSVRGGALSIKQLQHDPVLDRQGVVIDLAVERQPASTPPVTGVAVYPEWDERRQGYRPAWCTVIEVVPRPDEQVPLDRPARHDALRRELGQLGLGVQRVRRRPEGHDLDIDAAIEARVIAVAGRSPDEAVYVDNLWRRRELGVLVLLDASGSADESSSEGGSIHERQRNAAAALVDTLAMLGDRVAAYAFRSWGRSSVTFTVLKTFDEPFGAATMARIGGIEPGGYTRLGAAIRHGSSVLATQAGTPYKLLVVVSDGFPFDHGYEGRHAECDVRKALDEAKASGVGCLCLDFGLAPSTEVVSRTYGATAHASADDIDAMTPSMLRLFRGALITTEARRRATNAATRRTV